MARSHPGRPFPIPRSAAARASTRRGSGATPTRSPGIAPGPAPPATWVPACPPSAPPRPSRSTWPAARADLDPGRLTVAGSTDGRARPRESAAAGADAFTVGSAALDGSGAWHAGTPRSRLRAALADRHAAVA